MGKQSNPELSVSADACLEKGAVSRGRFVSLQGKGIDGCAGIGRVYGA
ncbi:MAG: hypothetical protein MI684_11805 [Chlorobiales bacterium]|nr:hypothetical protein [Chlorobiales bacterium]